MYKQCTCVCVPMYQIVFVKKTFYVYLPTQLVPFESVSSSISVNLRWLANFARSRHNETWVDNQYIVNELEALFSGSPNPYAVLSGYVSFWLLIKHFHSPSTYTQYSTARRVHNVGRRPFIGIKFGGCNAFVSFKRHSFNFEFKCWPQCHPA